jgi:hypothetical protein
MLPRHKVFVSYFHEEDQAYRQAFETLSADVIVSRSVDIGDIDPSANTEYVRQRIRDEYLRESSVTIVLVGKHTWKRKHVDWEIYSSLRDTTSNPRSGLLGILLPTYNNGILDSYNAHLIPPRLWDNLESRANSVDTFARMYGWTTNPAHIQQWVHEAFLRKDKIQPVNSRPMYANNRSGDSWTD